VHEWCMLMEACLKTKGSHIWFWSINLSMRIINGHPCLVPTTSAVFNSIKECLSMCCQLATKLSKYNEIKKKKNSICSFRPLSSTLQIL
jgi:hypothetical protein